MHPFFLPASSILFVIKIFRTVSVGGFRKGYCAWANLVTDSNLGGVKDLKMTVSGSYDCFGKTLERFCQHKNSDFKIGEESEGEQSSLRTEVRGLVLWQAEGDRRVRTLQRREFTGWVLGEGLKDEYWESGQEAASRVIEIRWMSDMVCGSFARGGLWSEWWEYLGFVMIRL